MKEKTYKFNKSSLTLRFGDITTANTDVIVSSDDYYLSMGGGVSAAILEAGGNEIARDAAKKVPAKLGDVIVTTAGRLKSKFVFHAITIDEEDTDVDPKEIITSTTLKCLDRLMMLGLESIAFPAIGAGVAGFAYEEVAIEMAEIISNYLISSEAEVNVVIYLFDRFDSMEPTDFIIFFEAFASRAPGIAQKEINKVEKKEAFNLKTSVQKIERETKARRLHNLQELLAMLDDQKYKLERRLVELSGSNEKEEIAGLKLKLKENDDLRFGKMKELNELKGNGASKPVQKNETLSVFLSSTYIDLVEYRRRLIDQISRRNMFFIGMEHWGADAENQPPAQMIVQEVNRAHIYVGVFGVRYGSIDPASGLSMTELEYRQAKTSDKKMLLYLIKDTANVKVSDFEKDPTGKEKLERLKAEIRAEKTYYGFDSPQDLERQLFEDLGKVLAR